MKSDSTIRRDAITGFDKPLVLIVDDEPDVRECLQIALSRAGLECQPFSSAEELMASPGFDRASCLVLDHELPGMHGAELQNWLITRQIAIPVLIVTGHASVPTAVQAMKRGAVDVLLKPVALDLLVARVQEAIAAVAASGHRHAQRAATLQRLGSLSRREREIMVRLAASQTRKRIAADLGISPKTVDVHRGRILTKLELDTTVELAAMANRFDLI